MQNLISFKTGLANIIGLMVSSPALAGLTLMLSALQAAQAEGFPGIGERVEYAESLPHYNLGNRYLAKQWYEKAIEKYNDSINIYPYDADVYTNLSVAYRKLGDLSGAESTCRKAVDLNDKDWTTLGNLANLLMAQEKFPEAYKFFAKALKLDIPAAEKGFIESNIEGMKKILKARGLGLDGKPLAPPTVPNQPARRWSPAGDIKRRSAGVKSKMSNKSSRAPERKPASPAHTGLTAGSAESDIDSRAFEQWRGD